MVISPPIFSFFSSFLASPVASFSNMDTSSNSGLMPGVTRTRGSARADHSIDATPPAAPAPAPQSLLGYMTSRLCATPASGVVFSPAVESPESSPDPSEHGGSLSAAPAVSDVELATEVASASATVAPSSPAGSTTMVLSDSTVAGALREIADLDRRRSTLESVLLQADLAASQDASSSEHVASVPGANTGRLISHLISPEELISMARSLSQSMPSSPADLTSDSLPSVGAILRKLDANFDRHPKYLQQEIERGLVHALITTMETHDIGPTAARTSRVLVQNSSRAAEATAQDLARQTETATAALLRQVSPVVPDSSQSVLDSINADANDRFDAFLRSEEHRNARELRDGEDEVHIPVPEDGVDYGEDEYDANVTMLSDFQPDPQELLHALQQGVAIHDGTSLLNPAIEIPPPSSSPPGWAHSATTPFLSGCCAICALSWFGVFRCICIVVLLQ